MEGRGAAGQPRQPARIGWRQPAAAPRIPPDRRPPCLNDPPAPARPKGTPHAPTTPPPVIGCASRCTCPSTNERGPAARARPAGRTANGITAGSPVTYATATPCAGATRPSCASTTTRGVDACSRVKTQTTGRAQGSRSSTMVTTPTTRSTVEVSAMPATAGRQRDTRRTRGIVAVRTGRGRGVQIMGHGRQAAAAMVSLVPARVSTLTPGHDQHTNSERHYG